MPEIGQEKDRGNDEIVAACASLKGGGMKDMADGEYESRNKYRRRDHRRGVERLCPGRKTQGLECIQTGFWVKVLFVLYGNHENTAKRNTGRSMRASVLSWIDAARGFLVHAVGTGGVTGLRKVVQGMRGRDRSSPR